MLRYRVRSYISSHPAVARRLLVAFVKMHNYSYHKISELAGYLNHGIHPKHFITNYHEFFLSNVTSSDRIIDLGSGSGFLASDLAKKAKSVLGIDWSETNVQNAKRDYSANNLAFMVGDITTHQFEERYDRAVLSNVLEHISDRIALLKSVRKISPILLLRVPMVSRDWITVYKKQEGFEYRLDETHYTEYTLESFFEEMKEAGWRVRSYQVNWGELWALLETSE